MVQAVRDEQGKVHPVGSIKLITLYATPLLGSAAANAAHAALSVLPKIKQSLVAKQVADLRTGEFVQKLLRLTNKLTNSADR